MKRVLITGHSGMLGRSLVNELAKRSGYELYGVSKTSRLENNLITQYQIDLTNEDAVRDLVLKVAPDLIIHTAALTNLSFCEANIDKAYKVHVGLTQNLASYEKARFIYISTDSVFNGVKGFYNETDPSYPLNYYAQSKLQGEWVSLKNNKETLVIRTNIYGFKNPGGNSLAEWALKAFEQDKTIAGFGNVWFNPLYVGQLSWLIASLIDIEVFGILHVGCSENQSKFEFLKTLASEFGYPTDLVTEAQYVDDQLRRPKNTTLDTSYLKKLGNYKISLTEGIQQLRSDYLKAYGKY